MAVFPALGVRPWRQLLLDWLKVAHNEDGTHKYVYNIRDYGALGDGTTDDSTAILNCLNAANGRPVNAPAGVYRITQPLSNTTASVINLVGPTPAFLTHNAAIGLIDTYSADYAAFDTSVIPEMAIFKCDNCNLIGAPDTGTMNASSKVLLLRDFVAYGQNGAKHGIYSQGNDLLVSGVTLALFEHFGIFGRANITSSFRDVATIDCGWNLAHSGTATYPNTYYSGCGILLNSNITAGDYTTLNPTYRPTTMYFDNIFIGVRNHSITTKSGFRGVQISGLGSGRFDGFSSYTGNYFYLCNGLHLANYHLENYSTNGFTAADATPRALYMLNCQWDGGAGYAANFGAPAVEPVVVTDTGTTGIYWQSTRNDFGEPLVRGASRSSIRKEITIGTPGGTDNYDFKNVAEAWRGFNGFCAVSVVKSADYTNFTRTFHAIATHKAGGSGWQPMTTHNIHSQSSMSGAFAITVAVSWVNGDLRVAITWGASWAGATAFTLDIGLFGLLPLSA